MIQQKQIIALVLVAVMVASAGCAGWGTDGPSDNDAEQSNDTDDLNQTQNETNQSNTTNNSDGTTGGDSSGAGASDGDDSSDSSSGDSNTSDSPDSSSDDSTESDSSDSTDSSEKDDESKGTSDASPQGSDPGDDTSTDDDSDASDDTSDKKDTTDETDEKDDKSETPSDSDDKKSDDTNDTDETSDNQSEQPPANGDDNETPTEPEGNTVTIDVRDLETDEPVDIPIRLNGIDTDYDETVNSTDGTATFENVPSGEYEVKTTSDEWWTQYGSVHDITVDGDTSYTLGVNDALEEHTLTVTVTDAETGDPVEGATVSGVGDRHPSGADILIQGETNADGVATITAPESGYILDVSAEGYEPDTKEVRVESDTETSFEVQPSEQENQYAPASAVDVESVKHAGAEPFTDYDQMTIVNTHSDLPLDVSGWAISTSDRTPEMTIPDGTVLAPGETYVIVLDAEAKMLDASGGVLEIYPTDGSDVMEWNYVGSPSAPYLPPEEPNESGNATDTNSSQAAVA